MLTSGKCTPTKTLVFAICLLALLGVSSCGRSGSTLDNDSLQETIEAAVLSTQSVTLEGTSIPVVPTNSARPPASKTSVPITETLVIATPEPTLIPTPIPPPYRLVGFDYTLTDVGDGWNEGSVKIAFENLGDELIEYSEYSQIYIPLDANVETAEGVTYPVKWKSEWLPDHNIHNNIEVSYLELKGVVLPSYRIALYSISNSYAMYALITWKSAVAATPIRVVFPSNPELTFDLPSEKSTMLDFPFDPLTEEMQTIQDLTSEEVVNNPQGLEVKLTGSCSASKETLYLSASFINHDKFNEAIVDISGELLTGFYNRETGISTYIEVVGEEANQEILYSIGPDQSLEGWLRIPTGLSHAFPPEDTIVALWLYNQDDLEYELHLFDALQCSN